jgi:hypothetical protein
MKITRTQAEQVFNALGCKTAQSWNALRMGQQLAKIGNLVDGTTNIGELQPVLDQILAATAEGQMLELEGADVPAAAAPAQALLEDKAAKKAAADKAKADAKEAAKVAAAAKKAAADKAKADAKAADKAKEDTKADKATPAAKKEDPAANGAAAAAGDIVAAAGPAAALAAAAQPAAAAKVVEPKGPWDIKAPGVRAEGRSRGFMAGLLYADLGLEAGVTDKTAVAYELANGIENHTQTRFNLGMAWHIINGYREGLRRKAAGEDVVTTPDGKPV